MTRAERRTMDERDNALPVNKSFFIVAVGMTSYIIVKHMMPRGSMEAEHSKSNPRMEPALFQDFPKRSQQRKLIRSGKISQILSLFACGKCRSCEASSIRRVLAIMVWASAGSSPC